MNLPIIMRIVSIRKSLAKPEATRVRSQQRKPEQTSGVKIVKISTMTKYGIIILSQIFRKEKGRKINGIMAIIKYIKLS